MKPINVTSLTITLKDGRTIALGRGILIEGIKCPGGMLENASQAYQKLDHAMATARVTLRPDATSNGALDAMLAALREEMRNILIDAEKQKPPFWAKTFKGQRS